MKVVMVEWDDACMSGHWIDGKPSKPKAEIVWSVGYLARKTKRHIVLVQSMSEDVHGNALQIPRGMILSMRVLEN